MSKARLKVDDGYPFATGHWESWNNAWRLRWMRNFRDQLSKNNGEAGKKLGLTEKDLDQIKADTAELEQICRQDLAVMPEKLRQAEASRKCAEELILTTAKDKRPLPLILTPNAILGKKRN